MEQDSCARAAQAAIEVVREECSGMDVEVREIETGMLIELPSEVAEMIDAEEGTPVSMDAFETIVSESGFIRGWLSGIVASEDVRVDASNPDYASRVHTFAESVFDDGLAFGSEDLEGSSVLQMIANHE